MSFTKVIILLYVIVGFMERKYKNVKVLAAMVAEWNCFCFCGRTVGALLATKTRHLIYVLSRERTQYTFLIKPSSVMI